MQKPSGNIFVVSAPSGTGKSTLCRRLVREIKGLIFSTSFTTRPPRSGEVPGKDYFFLDDAEFQRMVDGNGFLEWVEVYGRRYGTGRAWIEAQLAAGVDILLDIETIGAATVHEAMPEAVMIFILPPSAAELERRLRGRGTDSDEQIRLRLAGARREMERFEGYDHLVVNDDLVEAYHQLSGIIYATRCRQGRVAPTARRILDSFPATPTAEEP